MSRLGSALRAVLCAVVALMVACLSPTLPLPPPTPPTVFVGTEPGTFRLQSEAGALPNALIVVINRNEALPRNERVEATLADERGSWDLVVKASVGDVLDISQEDGSTRSPTTTVQVR